MKSFDEFWGEFAIGLNAHENEAQSIWEAGAQSRQSEVDELTGKLKNSEYLRDEHLEARRRLYKDNCELQKRIDDALDYVFGLYTTGDLDTEKLENILKGETNES